jgi:hypothetical protein
VHAELVRQGKESGVSRAEIAARILTEHLVGGIVKRELAACPREPQPQDVRFDANNGYKMATGNLAPCAEFLCKCVSLDWLPRMDSNHDKVIQSHLVHDGCAIVATFSGLRAASLPVCPTGPSWSQNRMFVSAQI